MIILDRYLNRKFFQSFKYIFSRDNNSHNYYNLAFI